MGAQASIRADPRSGLDLGLDLEPTHRRAIYYLLYVTGQMMFGHWGYLSGYADFALLARDLHEGNRTLLQDVELLAKILLEDWGLTMLVGSIPWAAIVGALGYWGSLKFVEAYRREKAARRAKPR